MAETQILVKSSHRSRFVKKSVFKNFAKFTGKHLCQRLTRRQAWNFIKKETLAQLLCCEFCEIFKNTFFTEHTTASGLWDVKARVYNDHNARENASSAFRFISAWRWFLISFPSSIHSSNSNVSQTPSLGPLYSQGFIQTVLGFLFVSLFPS